MSVTAAPGGYIRPDTLDAAIDAFVEGRAMVLGGGTWFMRHRFGAAAMRESSSVVDVTGIAELHEIDVVESDGTAVLTIGAAVTHQALAASAVIAGHRCFAAVSVAASISAFTQVRNIATIAGNVAAREFTQADLVPMLVAFDADVIGVRRDGQRHSEPIRTYLQRAPHESADLLILGFRLASSPSAESGFSRITVRAGAEYPLVNVCVVVERTDVVSSAVVVVGAVQDVPVVCERSADELVGVPLEDAAVERAADIASTELVARDTDSAPAWYVQSQISTTVAAAFGSLVAGRAS